MWILPKVNFRKWCRIRRHHRRRRRRYPEREPRPYFLWATKRLNCGSWANLSVNAYKIQLTEFDGCPSIPDETLLLLHFKFATFDLKNPFQHRIKSELTNLWMHAYSLVWVIVLTAVRKLAATLVASSHLFERKQQPSGGSVSEGEMFFSMRIARRANSLRSRGERETAKSSRENRMATLRPSHASTPDWWSQVRRMQGESRTRLSFSLARALSKASVHRCIVYQQRLSPFGEACCFIRQQQPTNTQTQQNHANARRIDNKTVIFFVVSLILSKTIPWVSFSFSFWSALLIDGRPCVSWCRIWWAVVHL